MTLESILTKIEHTDQIILAGLFVVGGCIATFWGERLFKQIIFFIGFTAGTLFTYFIVNTIDVDVSLRVHLLVSFAIGIFIGFCCVIIYKMSVFTTGAVAGLIAGQFLWQFAVSEFPHSFLMDRPEIYNSVVILVCALIGGFVAFKLMEVVLRGLTAFVGSFCVTSGSAYFISVGPLSTVCAPDLC